MIHVACFDLAVALVFAGFGARGRLLPRWLEWLLGLALLGTCAAGYFVEGGFGVFVAILAALVPLLAWLVLPPARCDKCAGRLRGEATHPLIRATATTKGSELVWLDCESGGHVFQRATDLLRPSSSGGGGSSWSSSSSSSGDSSSSAGSSSSGGGFSGGGGGSSGGGGADREY